MPMPHVPINNQAAACAVRSEEVLMVKRVLLGVLLLAGLGSVAAQKQLETK